MKISKDCGSGSIVFSAGQAEKDEQWVDSFEDWMRDRDERDLLRRPSPWSCTLDEVASELGLSREKVRSIEQRALRKCRAFCRAHGLVLEDLLSSSR